MRQWWILATLAMLPACGGNEKCDTKNTNGSEATVASLESQVAELTAQLEQAQADLAVAETDLATAQTDLAAAEDALAEAEDLLGPPPAWLDDLYPPTAAYPVLMMEMFALSGPFEAMILDMQAGDTTNVSVDFAAFAAQYDELRTNVIPDWADKMPTQPIDDLDTALQSGDPAQIGAAIGAVGAVCGECHQENMLRVQIQYHWPDFHDVPMTDPIASTPMEWREAMTNMALYFNGVTSDLSQGQVAEARTDFTNFRAYFDEVTAGCDECHDTPRAYFVDASVQADLDALEAALQSATPDPAVVGGLAGSIGQASCGGCHLVHTPSALTKHRWEAMAP